MSVTRLAYYFDSQSRVVINKTHLKYNSFLSACNSISYDCFRRLVYSLIYNSYSYKGTAIIEETITKKIAAFYSKFTNCKEYIRGKSLNF